MFSDFKKAVVRQFEIMHPHGLYRVQVEKDALWETYLSSFPAGSNPVFKERTEHDCQCCKHFVRAVGGLVTIVNRQLVSIWDVDDVPEPYRTVAAALNSLVKSAPIDNVFLSPERQIGTDKNFSTTLGSTEVVSWEHFAITLPSSYVARKDGIATTLGEIRSTKDVMLRGLTELTLDAADTILELVAQNSLYRGEEQMFAVESFRKLKKEFDKAKNKDLFVWQHVKSVPGSVARIRNSAIGTLLINLSEGMDLEQAVNAFERGVMAPTNYKRPTALVTKDMIRKAQEKIEELGFTSALERRYATLEDITINNILYADRTAKKQMNVFDQLSASVTEKVQKMDRIDEISIDDFIANVLPKAESVEVMFENRHSGNLVSLIAPVDPSSKSMFKWPNNFSWSYAGELADSIKERVKRAGGRVDGDLRCSLSWFNYDDLDLHMIEAGGMPGTRNSAKYEIYFGTRGSVSPSGGTLDVDMNAGSRNSRTPVENITYDNRRTMREGTYELFVYQFNQRETQDGGFDVEIEFDGTVYSFHYPKVLRTGDKIVVAKIQYSKTTGFKIIESLPSSQTSKTVWGVPTQTFHKVNVVMLSPNFWDDKTVGNKHYFFMLDGCLNETKARGFFNEFLTAELDPHRKVFEMVGSKMKTEESDRQLSGLGFSSTQRNYILVRVKGAFTRTVKITF